MIITLNISATKLNPQVELVDYKREMLVNKLLKLSKNYTKTLHKIKSPTLEYRGFSFNWHGFMRVCNNEVEVFPYNIYYPVFYLTDNQEIEDFFKDQFQQHKFYWGK